MKSDAPARHVWTKWTVLGTAGLGASFLFATAAATMQLRELGVADALLRLAPICAAGSVLAGWFTGAAGAGARWRLSIWAACVAGVAILSQVCLTTLVMLRTAAALWRGEQPGASSESVLVAMLLAVIGGFCLEEHPAEAHQGDPDV